jgi:hypothetical protein
MPELVEHVQRGFTAYAVERELGTGGMATVYLAHDRKHDRKVAIKILHAELAAMVGVARFLGEIKVTAHLQHPHILGLIDSGTLGDEAGELRGRPYYVMPFVDGESLRDRLEREGQLPVFDAVRIASEVASALEYAHRQGVIHRDIKPGNILLLQDGSAIVADFGIALALSQAGGARITQSGLSIGTPAYMSPEQAAAERTITARTDVYSLAAVTYEMLSGEPPFTGPSEHAVIARVLMEEPHSLVTRRRSIPLHVEVAVFKALEKLPADRFGSAHEFAQALSNGSFAHSLTPPRLIATRDDARYRKMFYGVTATALLLLALAAWGWLRPTPRARVARYTLVFDSTEAMGPLGDYHGRFAISPDGSHLAYVGGPGQRLLIRSRNQLHAVPVRGTEGTVTPFFSPDGKNVGGVIDRQGLAIAPVGGGPAITITSPLAGTAGASWGSDGFIYLDASASSLGGGLMRLEAKPGALPQAFTRLDSASGEIDHSWPDVLPNGKGVICTVVFNATKAAQRGSITSIAVAELPSGRHRILIDGGVHALYSASGHLLYVTTRNVLMAVPFNQNSMKITGEPIALVEGVRTGIYGSTDLAISGNGTLVYGTSGGTDRELVWVTRDGKVQPVDPEWRAPLQDPALSPDGKRVAVSIADADGATNVWIKQLDRGPTIKVSLEGRTNVSPTWTPDGRSLTFASDAGGTLQPWTRSADGTGQGKMELRDPRGMFGPIWSHDRQWLLMFTDFNSSGASDVVGFRPGVDSAATPLIATRFVEASPQLSPDGRWLAYTSSETGQPQVYVTPFPATKSGKWAISTRGGALPRWSHSGKELFFVDSVGNFTAAEINTKGGFSVGRATPLFPTQQLWLDNFGPGVPQYSVSPDDRRFIMVRPISHGAPDRVVVVDNWFEELNAK